MTIINLSRKILACLVLILCFPQIVVYGDGDLSIVFIENRDELIKTGIHRFGKFIFSAQSARVDSADTELGLELTNEKIAFNATQGFLLAKVSESLPLADRSVSVRNVAQKIALSCASQAVEVRSISTVFSNVIDGKNVVVQGMSIAEFDRIQIKLENLVPCIAARAETGPISVPEAMILLELCPENSPLLPRARGVAVETLSRAYGPGIELTVRRVWSREDKCVPQVALELWCLSAQQGILAAKNLTQALVPVDPAKISTIQFEELFAFLGHRMQDPNAIGALVKSLSVDGWRRCAELFPAQPLSISAIHDHAGSKLSPDLRAKIAATPAMTFLLLTGGDGAIDFKSQESQLCKDAWVAFKRNISDGHFDPKGPPEAAQLLQQDLEAGASYESIILFSATLLALNDPGLAYPLAKTSFIHNPADPFAGVNLLLAARALDLRDEVKDLLPKVQAQAKLDSWGIDELKKLHSWLNGDQPVATPAPDTLTP